MADNERNTNFRPPRRNPQQNRPPPGVQKAIVTLGVRDLREILDKKRQEQGESQGNKVSDPRLVKLPPPDPSYNFLKDPTRDRPPPQKRTDQDKQYEKPINRDQETYTPHHRYKNEKHMNRDREIYSPKQRYRDVNNSSREHEQLYQDTWQQDNKENNINSEEKGALKKNQHSIQTEAAPKKELRFADSQTLDEKTQFARSGSRDGRHSFRGRNARRGGGIPRGSKEEKIENPVNIKIELTIKTGQRNCTLDENTKIPDIKHVPDKISQQRYPRGGGFRGSRSNFRGRIRGRGSFRGRGAYSNRGKGSESKVDDFSHDSAFNMKKLQEILPAAAKKESPQSVENRNVQGENTSYQENNQDNNDQNGEAPEDLEGNFEHYNEYDQENEEFNDANENYDEEFSSEYHTEYQDDSAEQVQHLDNSQQYESVLESERYDHGSANVVDPNLKATITITSSKFQDGEVQRSVKVNATNNEVGNQSDIDSLKNESKVTKET